MAAGIFGLPKWARLDGMDPSIKGVFGKNQGFRAFAGSHSTIFALAYAGNCCWRNAGHLPHMSYDRK